MSFVGVDVAKEFLVVSVSGKVQEIKNEKKAVKRFVTKLPEDSVIAIEPTGKYHLLLADTAFNEGLAVYLVNPKEFRNYKDSVNFRAKTDMIDALVLERYAEKEHERLFKYVPKSAKVGAVSALLRLRACVVDSRKRMAQSFSEVDESLAKQVEVIENMLSELEFAISQLEVQIEGLLSDEPLYHKLQKIVGVGKIISAAMCTVLLERTFRSSDAFVAYLGLDIQVYQSGQKRGQGRLTKRGNPLFRQLLYVAASAAILNKLIRPTYEGYLLKGKHRTQALVIMARKIARTIWSIATKSEEYSLNRFVGLDIKP